MRLVVMFLFSFISPTQSFHVFIGFPRTTASTKRSFSWRQHAPAPSLASNHITCLHPTKQQPRKSATALACYLMPVCAMSPSVSAFVALIVSTLIGVLSESFVSNIGILVTLLTAAALSNLRLVPLLHPFYDLCWNIFLPGSLAFLLLSSSSNENHGDRNASINNVQVAETVKRVAVPFVIGSIGSILGCIASFLICQRWQTLWLPPTSAGVAASCLCASYVGGSVNFFATANLLSSTQSDLMASMATADLVVMAIYFVFLTAAIQSKRLQRLFDGTENATDSNGKRINEDLNMNVNSEFRIDASEEHRNQASRGDAVMATMMVSSLAFLLVQIANRVERYVSNAVHLPGTACATIALLTTLFKKFVPNTSDEWKRMQRVAGPLSNLCLYVFFASLGVRASIGNALMDGPSCLWFSMTALCIHVVITLGGSLVWKRIFNAQIRLQHVLVASNAAIGGPATAAAFCGQVPNMASGLTLAATIWGVVGYAVGTSIGVALSRFLSGMI